MSLVESSSSSTPQKVNNKWSKYVTDEYDPIKVGSIDGTDEEPHDRAIIRAINSKYKPNHKVIGDPNNTIFIGRLHIKTDEETLTKKFKRYGTILRCRVVRDIVTGISRTYAFIEYKHRSSVKEAISEMNKQIIDNCEILVDYECERTLKGWKPRRLGGGFGGKKESGQLRFGCRDRPFQRPLQCTAQPSQSSDLREVYRDVKRKRHNK